MHAGLSAQKAIRVVALNFDTSGLDARYIALGLFQNLRLETFTLAVAQVLAQQHGSPILRLGATCTCLDINETIIFVERVREHTPEFQRLDLGFQLLGIRFNGD